MQIILYSVVSLRVIPAQTGTSGPGKRRFIVVGDCDGMTGIRWTGSLGARGEEEGAWAAETRDFPAKETYIGNNFIISFIVQMKRNAAANTNFRRMCIRVRSHTCYTPKSVRESVKFTKRENG